MKQFSSVMDRMFLMDYNHRHETTYRNRRKFKRRPNAAFSYVFLCSRFYFSRVRLTFAWICPAAFPISLHSSMHRATVQNWNCYKQLNQLLSPFAQKEWEIKNRRTESFTGKFFQLKNVLNKFILSARPIADSHVVPSSC